MSNRSSLWAAVICFTVGASLVACGAGSVDFGDGGADATLKDATVHPDATGAGPEAEEFLTIPDAGTKDAADAESGSPDAPSDAADAVADRGAPVDASDRGAPDDSAILDADLDASADVFDAGDSGGTSVCEAGTVVDCKCGVHWTCTGGGWTPDFKCSGPCPPPPVCLPPGAPVDLGVVECATGLTDGGFLPCCSGSASAFLCTGTCS